MKNNQNICILGGAGYVGLFLVHLIKKEYPDSNITIVTQNTTKAVFFRLPNVQVISHTNSIQGKDLLIINLAYSVADFYSETKSKNLKIFEEIKDLIEHNNVTKIVHISSIVLSQGENTLQVSKIKKEDTYYYAKSYFENILAKYVEKKNIPTVILRSGNIIGPGSPWVNHIIARLSTGKALVGTRENYPSNSTYVGNLCCVILKLCNIAQSNNVMVMNMCEFGKISWKTWIDKINNNFDYPIKQWNIDSLQEIPSNLKTDFSRLKAVLVNDIILTLIKGRASNRFIISIIDKFGLKNVKQKSKASVKQNNNKKNQYIDLTEYSIVRVFLNSDEKYLENMPDEILNNLPYTFEDALISIENWMKISGYSKLSKSTIFYNN